MYLFDYHMHSTYSSDGHCSVEKMCQGAISAGIKEIAITDHFEPTLGNETYPFYKAEDYFIDILSAKVIFGNKLKVKSGVELGQPHLYPTASEELLASYPYDFVLASVHKMEDSTDFGEIAYNIENISFYCDKYLDALKNLSIWNKFDCLSHLDLVKRYAALNNIKVDLMVFKERLEEILKIIIQNGKGIEVNSSGLRQAAQECLPGLDILRLYKELGGQIITVGSDSHFASDVGKGIKEAIELIKLAGFKYLTLYTARKPSFIKITDDSFVKHVSEQTA